MMINKKIIYLLFPALLLMPALFYFSFEGVTAYDMDLKYEDIMSGEGGDLTIKWQKELERRNAVNQLIIADIDADGYKDVLARTNKIYALNKDGKQLWQSKEPTLGDVSAFYVSDIDGDGKMETLAGTTTINIYLMDSKGSTLLDFDVHNPVTSMFADDVTGDGIKEIIAGTSGADRPSIYVLEVRIDGNNWGARTEKTFNINNGVSDVISFDLLKDGKKTIIAGGYYSPYTIFGIGHLDEKINFPKNVQWQFNISRRSTGIYIADIDNDNSADIMINSRWNFYCLNGGGQLRWRFLAGGEVYDSAVGDIDADGKNEVAVACGYETGDEGRIYLLNYRGELLWNLTASSAISSVALADLDLDGKMEVIAGSHNGFLYITDHTGELLWRYDVKSPVNAIRVEDIDNNGLSDIVLASGDVNKEGNVYVFEVIPSKIPQISDQVHENASAGNASAGNASAGNASAGDNVSAGNVSEDNVGVPENVTNLNGEILNATGSDNISVTGNDSVTGNGTSLDNETAASNETIEPVNVSADNVTSKNGTGENASIIEENVSADGEGGGFDVQTIVEQVMKYMWVLAILIITVIAAAAFFIFRMRRGGISKKTGKKEKGGVEETKEKEEEVPDEFLDNIPALK